MLIPHRSGRTPYKLWRDATTGNLLNCCCWKCPPETWIFHVDLELDSPPPSGYCTDVCISPAIKTLDDLYYSISSGCGFRTVWYTATHEHFISITFGNNPLIDNGLTNVNLTYGTKDLSTLLAGTCFRGTTLTADYPILVDDVFYFENTLSCGGTATVTIEATT